MHNNSKVGQAQGFTPVSPLKMKGYWVGMLVILAFLLANIKESLPFFETALQITIWWSIGAILLRIPTVFLERIMR